MDRHDDDALTFDTVVDLLAILDGAAVPTRIEYRSGALQLLVERGGAVVAAPAVVAPGPAAPAPVAVAAAAPAPAQQAPVAPAVGQVDDALGEPVRAPIAGVFYRAPSPDAPPFVEVGQQVDEDAVIGIVEVMKLMTTVRSGVAGVVTQVCAENGSLVEFEQVLVRVAPQEQRA